MAAFWGGRGTELEDDFDEYDPTPYGGGYDIAIAFGYPLSPSDEICHPIFSADGGDVDYGRPHYSYGSITSSYETEVDFGDRYGHPLPKPQPAYGFQFQQEEEGGDGYSGDRWTRPPRPDYGFGGGEGEFGSGQVFGYEGRQDVERHYGLRSLEEEGYGGGGRYRRTEEYGYGGKPTYGGDEEGTGRYQKPSYYGEEQGEGYGSPKYSNEYDEEKKHHHHRNYDDD